MFIVDSHLDIAYNAIDKNRNPLEGLDQIRNNEDSNETPTVSFQSIIDGGIDIVFATIFYQPEKNINIFSDRAINIAFEKGVKQIDYYLGLIRYRRLIHHDHEIVLIDNKTQLEKLLDNNSRSHAKKLGLVLMMEGADPIKNPDDLPFWFEKGLRIIGPAWSDTRYVGGAWKNQTGFTNLGYQLLKNMHKSGIILDISHMSEQGINHVLNNYEGAVIASHSNCQKIIDSPRHLKDNHIKKLSDKNGVIGIVLYNNFLIPDLKNNSPKESVTLQDVFKHIDHVCQILGNSKHVGIGSDLDGGFGREKIPAEIDSIEDLPKIALELQKHGYKNDDIENIMGLNWIRILKENLPD